MNRGFTLIETLVAITVLVTAVAGVLKIAGDSLRLTAVAREQLVAFYLAQEPIEFIRNVRDSNRLQTPPDPWLTHLSECISTDGTTRCVIDATESKYPPLPNTIRTCPILPTPCEILDIQTSTKLYGYGNGALWVPTKFTRTTAIITPMGGNADEMRIDVTVSWQVGLVQRSVTIQEYLLNW